MGCCVRWLRPCKHLWELGARIVAGFVNSGAEASLAGVRAGRADDERLKMLDLVCCRWRGGRRSPYNTL
eukprot:scaffold202642_cov39-Tisochrysis_lutea.AAC.2